MTEHSLAQGVSVLDSLKDVGRALGYEVAEEWAPAGVQAGIDLVYLPRHGDCHPVLAFEVESTASQGLANNAIKTFGRPSSDLPKPLHFFHIVVSGGTRSNRPDATAALLFNQNYSVHLLDHEEEPDRLTQMILSVHRRTTSQLDAVAVGLTLGRRCGVNIAESALAHARGLGFDIPAAAYTVLALCEPQFRRALREELRQLWSAQLAGERRAPNRYFGESVGKPHAYRSYMARAACEGLELGLLAALSPDDGPAAFAVLRDWQEANHIGDQLGEYTGSGSQWTEYVIEQMGYYWALMAALMRRVPGGRTWCASQPGALLRVIEDVRYVTVDLLAVWVMHAAAGDGAPTELYESGRRRIESSGGVAESWLAAPEPGPPNEEMSFNLLGNGVSPTPSELRGLVSSASDDGRDAVDLALSALIEDPILRPHDGAQLVRILACDSCSLPDA
jgi:hypothetical protein